MLRLTAFDLETEYAAAKTVAQRLEGDLITRVGSSLLTAGLMAWAGSIHLAFVWIVCVLVNELLEPSAVRQLVQAKAPSIRRLTIYTCHLTSGSAVWAGAGVALWMTRDPAVMTVGAVLMLGTLMHVTLIYAISRLLVLSVASPLILAMIIMSLLVLGDDMFAFRDKALVIFSVVILLAYLIMLLMTNIETQREMAKLADENAKQARLDPLTELANRRHFVEQIQALLARDESFALVFIDLDRFKPLNDEHGHAIGDESLKAIAARLKTSPQIDFVARLGGDEFGALIQADRSEAELENALRQIWNDVISTFETSIGPVDLGASIGCVRSNPSFDTHSKLMHAADVAMIRAKTNGGGVAVFDPALDAGMFEFAEIESAFRHAVLSGQIQAALQPIKCVRTQTITKMELLARWQRADGGKSLSPADFIPMAERLGLLNQILWSTLDQALPKVRGTSLTLAINISPSQLLSAQFFTKLEAVLKRHLVPFNQIELEITEQVALRNDKENLAHLQRANEIGFSIVLDDFGTGYSSISLLDKLPLSKVKLDHSFVRGAMETEHGKKLLTAIIGLLKQMNLRCCVEGVETEEIETFVAALGCEEVQGYLIGRPALVELDTPVEPAIVSRRA